MCGFVGFVDFKKDTSKMKNILSDDDFGKNYKKA